MLSLLSVALTFSLVYELTPTDIYKDNNFLGSCSPAICEAIVQFFQKITCDMSRLVKIPFLRSGLD